MTESELIKGILKADEKYFKELIDQFQPLVLNTCNSFLHSKKDAEDVTQEVFIEVLQSLHKFRIESKLSTWLYRISVNKSLNYIRDNKKRSIIRNIGSFFGDDRELQIIDREEEYADLKADEEDKLDLLYRAVVNLSKNQKVAFTLSKFEGLSYAEISDVMDLSLASVEGLIHRAKLNVQKYVLKYYNKKLS